MKSRSDRPPVTFRTSGGALRIFEGHRLIVSVDPGSAQMAALMCEMARAHSEPRD
jgi:hypothetical protein